MTNMVYQRCPICRELHYFDPNKIEDTVACIRHLVGTIDDLKTKLDGNQGFDE